MAFFGITALGYQDSIKSRCSTQRPVTCPASTGTLLLIACIIDYNSGKSTILVYNLKIIDAVISYL